MDVDEEKQSVEALSDYAGSTMAGPTGAEKPRRRKLLLVLAFGPWILVTVVGAFVGAQLASPKSKPLYMIAGAAIGWFGLAFVLRSALLIRGARRRRAEPKGVTPKQPLAPADYEDPGWPLGAVFRLAIPGWGVRSLKRSGTSILSAVRTIYLMLLLAPLILVYVLTQVHPSRTQDFRPSTVAFVLVLFGVQSLLTSRMFARRPLPTTDAGQLIQRYRALFFLRFAISESPILLGFVGFFLTGGRLWIYGVGLAVGFVGLLMMAPTRRSIQRKQAELSAAGSTLSLGQLLLSRPTQ